MSIATIAVLIFSILIATPAEAQRIADRMRLRRQAEPHVVAGQVLVQAAPGASIAEVKRMASAAGLEVARPLAARDLYMLRLPTVATEADTFQAVERLKQAGVFRYVGPNHLRPFLDVPNDPDYPKQWHLPLMNLPQAWTSQKGGPNVVIAMLDSGCDVTHPELAARIIGSKNYIDGSSDVTDNLSHGTVIAGMMTAVTDNGMGIAGITWQGCKLYVAKVGDTFQNPPNVDIGAADSAIIDAITYLRQTLNTGGNRVVACLPFGKSDTSDNPDPNNPVNAAILAAANEGIVFCIAAGDTGDQGNPAINPANLASKHPNILCVAACGSKKEQAYYSQARAYTTISAPGGNDPSFSSAPDLIYSTFARNVGGGDFFYDQGTSMAAGSAAGVVALLLSAGAQPGEIKSILTSTADRGGRAVPNPQFGYGVIDANAALAVASSSVTVASPADGAFVSGTVTVQLNVTNPARYQGAELTIDNDATVVATASTSQNTLTWDSMAVNPTTGAPRYANGSHTLNIKALGPNGNTLFTRQVKLDNPVAAITQPFSNGYVSKNPQILGTASALRTPTYTLEYATAAPGTWVPIVSNVSAIVNAAKLADWNLAGVPDGAITLRLRVKNQDGLEASVTRLVTVDQTPPTPVTGLQGTIGHQQVALSWPASTDNFALAGYNLYRSTDGSGPFTKLNGARLTLTQFTDTGLTNATKYFYRVTAVDAAGNESVPQDPGGFIPNRNGTTGGTVTSSTGVPLDAASITVLQNGAPVSGGTTTTDSSGRYAFPSPPGFAPGTYDIRATKIGFVPQMIRGVMVQFGQDALGRDFALQPQPAFPTGWSMFTLPYDFAGQDLSSVFDGGQVVAWNPMANGYVGPGDPVFPKPAPGVGYWVKRTATTPAVTGFGSLNAATTPTILPVKAGWNLLGNPYPFAIVWLRNEFTFTRAQDGKSAALSAAAGLGWAADYAWAGPTGSTLLYDAALAPGASQTIPAYGAFWYLAESDGTLTVVPRLALGRSAKTDGSAWSLPIQATSAGQTSTVFIGTSGTPRLIAAPPVMQEDGSGARLSIGDTTAGSARSYAASFQSTGAEHAWSLAVDAGDQPVTLTWPSASLVPRGWSLVLTDEVTGKRVSLRNASGYRLTGSRVVGQIKLELTRDTGARLSIANLTVRAGRGTAPVISFDLTAEGNATVSVLRANGEPLRTLTSRSLPVGSASVVWDLRESAGKSVPPGVYLVQVRATGRQGEMVRAVVPMTVVR